MKRQSYRRLLFLNRETVLKLAGAADDGVTPPQPIPETSIGLTCAPTDRCH